MQRVRQIGAGAALLALAVGLALWVLQPPSVEIASTPAAAPPVEPVAPAEAPAPAGDEPVVRSTPAPARPAPAPEPTSRAHPEAPDEEPGLLHLEVVDDRGREVSGALVVGRDCRFRTRTDAEGRFDRQVPAFDCTLQAVRMDGALPVRSKPVGVVVDEGGETWAELVLPSERTGGIGVWIEEHPDGVRVPKVMPGTPAWDAGLEAGDVIVEVDGTPAAVLSIEEFQQVMTGPEGTEVEFTVRYRAEDGGYAEDVITATRRFIESPNRY